MYSTDTARFNCHWCHFTDRSDLNWSVVTMCNTGHRSYKQSDRVLVHAHNEKQWFCVHCSYSWIFTGECFLDVLLFLFLFLRFLVCKIVWWRNAAYGCTAHIVYYDTYLLTGGNYYLIVFITLALKWTTILWYLNSELIEISSPSCGFIDSL